jgi:cell division septal protein FtsQ
MALKMRQSLAEFERDFHEEMRLDRHRRENLRKQAVARSRKRHREKRQKRSSVRFWVLVLSLILTALAVTIGMFETLYALLG